MQRELRKKELQLPQAEAFRILNEVEYVVLTTFDHQGDPCSIAVSQICENGCVYFHCAQEGEKLDNLRSHPRVGLFAVGRYHRIEEKFTVAYESVAARGMAEEVIDPAEKVLALKKISEKYAPSAMAHFGEEMAQWFSKVIIIKIKITEICGKGSGF